MAIAKIKMRERILGPPGSETPRKGDQSASDEIMLMDQVKRKNA